MRRYALHINRFAFAIQHDRWSRWEKNEEPKQRTQNECVSRGERERVCVEWKSGAQASECYEMLAYNTKDTQKRKFIACMYSKKL